MAAITDWEVDQRQDPGSESIARKPAGARPVSGKSARPAMGTRVPLAAPVFVRDAHAIDQPWKIKWNPDTCIRCGACVATCTFGALQPRLQRRGHTVSAGRVPVPLDTTEVILSIRQSNDLAQACRGCGMCEKVCPTGSIRPVANMHNRFAVVARQGGTPIKRGGRAHLIPGRILDSIKVGRISQMTDPSLDAARHTFDLLTPLGRSLPADKLPLKVENGKLVPAGWAPPVRWIYPILIGDMSIGALSWRMWEALALATAYLNEECGLPVRMCSGEGGMPVKLLTSKYLQYMIVQIASGHFGWNRIIKAMPKMVTDPAAILIKIGQGAKPGDGGLLPAAKVAPHIQAIRGVPRADLLSPPNHQGLYSIEESVQKMFLSMNAAFQFRVPVAIKVAASSTSVSVFNNLVRDPYHIVGGFFLDGIQGGTGAAHEVSLDHSGHPMLSQIARLLSGGRLPGTAGADPDFCRGRLRRDGRPGGRRVQSHLPRRERRFRRQDLPANRRLRRRRKRPLQRLQHRPVPGGHLHPGSGAGGAPGRGRGGPEHRRLFPGDRHGTQEADGADRQFQPADRAQRRADFDGQGGRRAAADSVRMLTLS